MATIYRFICEDKTNGKSQDKGVGKSVKARGKAGGVDYNRYQRITTTIGNKLVHGYYSKVVRFGKAASHLVYKDIEGNTRLSGISLLILIQFALRLFGKIWEHNIQVARQENASNYQKLSTGQSQISQNFSVTRDFFTGKITYRENK